MGSVVWFSAGVDAYWLNGTAADRVYRLIGIIILGIGSYFMMLWVLGFRLKDFSRQHYE